MGSPISSTLAEIYLQYFERIYIKQYLEIKNIIYYKRYVDDLFIIYRVIQKESALRWEMIVWVILSKKVHTNMGPILNGYGVMGIF